MIIITFNIIITTTTCNTKEFFSRRSTLSSSYRTPEYDKNGIETKDIELLINYYLLRLKSFRRKVVDNKN